MRGVFLVAVLLATAQTWVLAVAPPACAQDSAPTTLSPPTLDPALKPPDPAPTPTVPPEPVAAVPASPSPGSPSTEPAAAPEASPPPLAEAPPQPVPADPVVTGIRAKLADANVIKGVNPDDVAALIAFYGQRGAPLWTTDMGFTAKGQAAIFEIGNADDWGLAAAAFDEPAPGELPKDAEAQAAAEVKLGLALLKYARFARGGRLNPPEISDRFDETPPLRDPKEVLSEIAAAEQPDAYLRSLHPKHEQFERLRQALLKARGKSEDGKPAGNDHDIKRLIINMERWRWMPEDLGAVYVWNNSPEFMVYVIKDGKPIYADKTLVGTSAYATPMFSADMKTIVFNPDWVAPPTVVSENLAPPLREGSLSILKIHKLSVSYQGTPVDASRVDWAHVNVLNYTFSQKGGPENVLGKVKFLFPNRHTVYMHDTLPVRKKYFQKASRAIGHECVRMEKPERFAEVLLAEDKGWSPSQVKELWDNGVNKPVTIDRKIPVHMVYFTAVADETGKVATFPDLYGLDNKMAAALFGNAAGFPIPPPDTTVPTEEADASNSSTPVRRTASSGSDIASSLGGFAGD
jgi:murein L,D-transpeptidase YcbB/YkuD